MLCSHKKRTIFSHCQQLVRSLLVLHSLVKIFSYISCSTYGEVNVTRDKKKKIIFFAMLPRLSPGGQVEEPDGNRMAVSGIPLGRRSPWSFWSNPFWCISERRSWLRTPESLCPLFGIFDGGHGELRKVPVQHVDVNQGRISHTLCTRIINHGLRTP
ncbi:hypothetical protein CI102_11464 [Trichoderma harzianum]|nr:hypothetical protein CI102_11464 [Trichoderma harzianum]